MLHHQIRPCLIAVLLATLPTAAWANDIKPGEWTVTTRMEGPQLPDQLKEERTETQCMSEAETVDLAETMRQAWTASGCRDVQISQDGEEITGQAVCEAGGRTTTVDTEITVHDEEHYSSTVTTTNDATAILHEDATWTAPDCS